MILIYLQGKGWSLSISAAGRKIIISGAANAREARGAPVRNAVGNKKTSRIGLRGGRVDSGWTRQPLRST